MLADGETFFTGLILAKTLVAAGMVVCLSMVAEYGGPGLAGVVSGFPLGAALALFFVGLELGPAFAAQSAAYTNLGLVATQCFLWGYVQLTDRPGAASRWRGMVPATLGGVALFLAAAALLRPQRVDLLTAAGVALVSILVFHHVFRRLPVVPIRHRRPLGPLLMLARAAAAAAMILLVTGLAGILGPRWTGLLATFPATLLPLMVIIHRLYGAGPVLTIARNVPRGLIAIVVYTLAVARFYPTLGVYWGTLAAYLLAGAYLALLCLAWPRLLTRARLARKS